MAEAEETISALHEKLAALEKSKVGQLKIRHTNLIGIFETFL